MIRIGIDFGGTKIEVAALRPDGYFLYRRRAPNPRRYGEALDVAASLFQACLDVLSNQPVLEGVGIGIPGALSPATGRVRNANSTWLNDRAFVEDVSLRLGRPVRAANDANCFALSEARDGAGAGANAVFGLILGTGCGGGLVVGGALVEGVNRIAGEIGHIPLPWSPPDSAGPRECWCGRRDCLETYLSGPGLEFDFLKATGRTATAEAVVQLARAGEASAQAVLDRYIERLSSACALVCSLFDPEVIVLGGGLSNVDELYLETPPRLAGKIFSDVCLTRIAKARHGDSSGVRGAAWLWPLES